ncbi:unnamed protein product [Effrenium voratum]|nr:unnamed protein product [Effrenium voratum]
MRPAKRTTPARPLPPKQAHKAQKGGCVRVKIEGCPKNLAPSKKPPTHPHRPTHPPFAHPPFAHSRKRIEGGRAVFDVTLPKPLGITPRNFPNRPGVGIAGIKPGATPDLYNKKVLLQDAPGMFVLEGDEVVAVNGTLCEGQDLQNVSQLVKESEGDTLTLKLVRNYLTGPVKIIWKPSLKMATYKRGAILRACEETLGANVRYSCEDGWCSSCWHAEAARLGTL